MGVDLFTYRCRIGRYNARRKVRCGISSISNGINICSVVLTSALIMTLLVIGNVESNPGPKYGTKGGEDDFQKSVIEYMKSNQEDYYNLSDELMQLRSTFREQMEVFGGKLDQAVKSSTEMSVKMEQVELEQERMRVLNNRWDTENRMNNIIIYGVEEFKYERNIDTCYVVLDLLAHWFGLNLDESRITIS